VHPPDQYLTDNDGDKKHDDGKSSGLTQIEILKSNFPPEERQCLRGNARPPLRHDEYRFKQVKGIDKSYDRRNNDRSLEMR